MKKYFVDQKIKERHEMNESWYLGSQYKIYKEIPAGEDHDEPQQNWVYSVFLTKANIDNFYGQYIFYRMQLLHDTNRDLYLITTRWGQIGEDGMTQRTPYETLEKAKKEFHKIFKEKTGNLFEEIKSFKRVERKFNLAVLPDHDFNYKELLKNFDWKHVPECKVERKVKNLIKSFVHSVYYRTFLNDINVN